MVKDIREEGKTIDGIMSFTHEAFMTDIEKLNILRPTIICKATDHIKQQIEMVQSLEEIYVSSKR